MMSNIDWNSLKIVDLKVELEKRGLVKSGKKQELIDRLIKYTAENENVIDSLSNQSGQESVKQNSSFNVDEDNEDEHDIINDTDEDVEILQKNDSHLDAVNRKDKSVINTTGGSYYTACDNTLGDEAEDSTDMLHNNDQPQVETETVAEQLETDNNSEDDINIHADMSDDELSSSKPENQKIPEAVKRGHDTDDSNKEDACTVPKKSKEDEDNVVVEKERKPKKRGQLWGLKKTAPAAVITSKSIDEMLPDKKSARELDALVKERMEQMRSEGVHVVSDEEEGEIAEDTSVASSQERQAPLVTSRKESGELDEDATKPKDDDNEEVPAKPKKPKRLRLRETKVVGYSVDDPIRKGPARDSLHPESACIKILGLVRPFTNNQLKDLLSRFGNLKEETEDTKSFWLDRIKTRSYAVFDTTEDAKAARAELDNCRWPRINPRSLTVDFCSQEEFDWVVEHGDSGKPLPKQFVVSPPVTEESPVTENGQGKSPERKHRRSGSSPSAKRRKTKSPSPRGSSSKRPLKESNAREDRDRRHRDQRAPPKRRTSRSVSPERRVGRSRSPERSRPEKHSRSPSATGDRRVPVAEAPAPIPEKPKDDQPGRLLDQLFFKTKTTPFIYWMPLTDDQIKEKDSRKPRVSPPRRQSRSPPPPEKTRKYTSMAPHIAKRERERRSRDRDEMAKKRR